MAQFLGIDLGTQSMKALLIDPVKETVSDPVSVHYGTDLPQYHSPEGFLPHPDPAIRRADPAMWLDALDLLLHKMHLAGMDLSGVAGIAGSAQQHGTVYCNAALPEKLRQLDQSRSLAEQLIPTFSRPVAPIWMDASTTEECARLTARFGSQIRQRTGSAPAERFSAAQIMKFAAEDPAAYQQTAHLHLISSFFASVLAGENMPIDSGDGAGMNLADLHRNCWAEDITAFAAPDLPEKLPPLAPAHLAPGKLSAYFAKYGLQPGIPVTLWSGDNPNALIGCGGHAPGTAVISLGTSDTFFGSISDLREAPAEHGHIFGNPAGGFLFLLCFANGSLTREAFRKRFQMSREEFESAALGTAPGKYPLLPFLQPESTPPVAQPGMIHDFAPASLTPGEWIRALLESQILTMKFHAGKSVTPREIRLTGGASVSPLLRQLT
ncbi:MAG: carbohydrate kinase, partial [Lentisphaeria bacterium]|nr:carbohydrate kinase [Lentisphaeria bacterium]